MPFDVLILCMDLDELWIGDQVMIISLKQRAIFEGIDDNGLAKLKVGTDYTFVDGKDIQLISEEELANEKKQLLSNFQKRKNASLKNLSLKSIFTLRYYIPIINLLLPNDTFLSNKKVQRAC